MRRKFTVNFDTPSNFSSFCLFVKCCSNFCKEIFFWSKKFCLNIKTLNSPCSESANLLQQLPVWEFRIPANFFSVCPWWSPPAPSFRRPPCFWPLPRVVSCPFLCSSPRPTLAVRGGRWECFYFLPDYNDIPIPPFYFEPAVWTWQAGDFHCPDLQGPGSRCPHKTPPCPPGCLLNQTPAVNFSAHLDHSLYWSN